MSGRDPTATVLLPVYNGERHLAESLESILGQTYEDFELVVVDDGSTDSSLDVLRGYDDPRLRVVRNDVNLGLPAALNRGLAEARGRYVARQDADDVSERSRLERQVEFLDRHPEIGFVACAHRRIDDEGRVTGERPVPLTAREIRWWLLFLNAFAHSSVVVRRQLVEQLGGYRTDLPFAQDYELWSRIARHAPVAALPEPLVRYRKSAGSMTLTLAEEVDDVERITRDNVRRLGGRAAAIADELDVEAAWRVLFSSPSRVGFRRSATAARQILAIAGSFARHENLARRAAARHRAAIALQVARQLLRAALRRA